VKSGTVEAASESEEESKLAIRLLFAIVTCSICFSIASSQTLPPQVRQLLDARFPAWKLIEYQRPVIPGYPESSIFVDEQARNVFVCRLNLDTIPDYAIGIRLPPGSRPIEYFVAAISNGNSYKLFSIDSTLSCCQDQMLLSPSQRELNIFGEADTEITNYGKLSADREFVQFPTDCINITTIVQSSSDVNYVFIVDHFVMISSGD
jgi:hypothetical protein